MMVPTTNLDLTLDLFGEKMFAPIIAGPISHQQQFHPDGELATVRGASAAKTVMVVSSESSVPWKRSSPRPRPRCGIRSIPKPTPMRSRPASSRPSKPVQSRLHHRRSPSQKCHGGARRKRASRPSRFPPSTGEASISCAKAARRPGLIKGIMTPEEADAAIKHGIQGIVVSDYGGLLTRGMASSMEMLPSIADAVSKRAPVFIDGNFRRGSDIFKALAFGATAVMVGRPVMWGLAAYGTEGVQGVLEMLQTELARDMCQCGNPNLKSVDRSVVKLHA